MQTSSTKVCATFNHRPVKTGKAAVVQRSKCLRWPCGPKRPRTCARRCQTLTGRCKSGGELYGSGKIAPFSSLAIFCAAQNFRSGRRDHRRWPSVSGVSLTVANVCWTVTSGDEYDSPLQERFSKVRAVGPGLMPKVFKLDSYSVHTTSLQRPYSVHTSFPQCPYICEHSDLLGLFEEIRLSV